MARGFESKDVEYQQAEASRGRVTTPRLSADARRDLERKQTIELALVRSRAELATATSAAYRRMLEQAIADLEHRLNSHA